MRSFSIVTQQPSTFSISSLPQQTPNDLPRPAQAITDHSAPLAVPTSFNECSIKRGKENIRSNKVNKSSTPKWVRNLALTALVATVALATFAAVAIICPTLIPLAVSDTLIKSGILLLLKEVGLFLVIWPDIHAMKDWCNNRTTHSTRM